MVSNMINWIVVVVFLFPVVACAESLEERSKEQRFFEYFEVATRVYFKDCYKLPQSFSSLIASSTGCENWKGPYLKNDITDTWGNAYILEIIDEKTIRFSSGGKDKILGTSDDVSVLVKI